MLHMQAAARPVDGHVKSCIANIMPPTGKGQRPLKVASLHSCHCSSSSGFLYSVSHRLPLQCHCGGAQGRTAAVIS